MAKKRSKRPTKSRVKSKIMFFAFTLMAVVGLGHYHNELKPIIGIGADYLAELIIKPPSLYGNVLRVSDGDTLTVRDVDGNDLKLRLYGIDAPETSQKFGPESRQALEEMVSGKNVSFSVIDMDIYGRSISILEADGININEAMLAAGNAWYYTAYCKKSFCGRWERIAAEAKSNRSGLWKQAKPIPPWEYRN